ncbi:polysaccharide pyruvyl transferase family protein [Aeromicrobium sp. UC242_57]|uniref:polysaccharide pyruvyl transferase family protein n=1 Tax=Aeromicrobium sp. UC242_57 TaxID=3374624 RepID=UPI0037A74EFC
MKIAATQARERWSQAQFMWASLRTMKWSKNAPKAVLLGSPFHSNLGDQAQTLCTEDWLARAYPNFNVVVFDTRSATVARRLLLRIASRFIGPSDVIFLHSGYHTTDIYPLEIELQKWTASRFSLNQIVVLPQTINFVDPKEEAATASVFNAHPNLVLICRDSESHGLAQEAFGGTTIYKYPDMVTSQIGTRRFEGPREGIQLCVRSDVESVYVASGLVDALTEGLNTIGPTTVTDTNSKLDAIHIRRKLPVSHRGILGRFLQLPSDGD